MVRNFWKPTLALGVLLAVSGIASAGDTQLLSGGPAGSTTMTLGGQGTAKQAATEDNELTYYRHYGGYHGWHGGYGYRGYYGGYRGYYGGYRGFYGGYRPYAGFYRPYYGGYYGYRPAFYRGYYGVPYYGGGFYSSYYYPSYGYCLGISGDVTNSAPTVNLGNGFAAPQPAMDPPVAPNDGTFQYDGGPKNPVPQPLPDKNINPQQIPPSNPTAITTPISGKATGLAPAATPYKYKAYGEK